MTFIYVMFKKTILYLAVASIPCVMLIVLYSAITDYYERAVQERVEQEIRKLCGTAIKIDDNAIKVSTLSGLPTLISINNPQVQLTNTIWQGLGDSNLKLNIPAELGDNLPRIEIKGGSITLQANSFIKEGRTLTINIDTITFAYLGNGEYHIKGKTTSQFADWSLSANVDIKSGNIDCTISSDNLRFDNKLYYLLAPEVQKLWDNYSPQGTASISIDLKTTSVNGATKVATSVTLYPRNITARYRKFPYTVDGLSGEIKFRDNYADVSLTAQLPISIAGKFGYTRADEVDITIHADNLVLDEKLKYALDKIKEGAWDNFNPKGQAKLELNISQERGIDKPLLYKATTHLKDCAIKYTNIPLDVTNVAGEIIYDDGNITLRHLSGTYKNTVLEIHGSLGNDETEINLTAHNLNMDSEFTTALPTEIRGMLEKLSISGPLDVDCTVDTRNSNQETNYAANIRFKDTTISSGVEFSNVDGYLSAEGIIRQGNIHNIIGSINLNKAKVSGKKITNFFTDFVYKDNKLSIFDVKLNAYSGTISGTFDLDTENGEYKGDFTANNINLRDYIKDTALSNKTIEGNLNLAIDNLSGKGSDLSTLTGRGTLKLTNGNVWDTPFFFGLFELNILGVGKKSVLTSGEAEFTMADKKFEIEKLILQGEDTLVAGKGYVKFDGHMSIFLDAQTNLGVGIPGIGLIEKAVDLIKNNVFSIEIYGRIEEPKSRLKAFK